MKRILPLAIAMLFLTGWRTMAEPGDAARGERVYRACVACHSLEANRNMTGPSLAELWNRKSGSLASFPRYSPALKSAGIIWNDDTLDEWVKDQVFRLRGLRHLRQSSEYFLFSVINVFQGIVKQVAKLFRFLGHLCAPAGVNSPGSTRQRGGMFLS